MKLEPPPFCVIIPVHNKRPHVQRSISSVLNQTLQDFELIIIDDASTDGSYEEVKKFNDKRIRIFRRDTPGPGGYAARNLGIKEAKGEWIAFLDADDEWESGYLKELHKLIKRFPNAGLLCTAYKIVLSDSTTLFNSYYRKKQVKKQHLFNIKDFLEGPRPPWTSATAVRKDLLKQVNGFNENWEHGADTDLWLRVLLTGVAGAWSPKIGATYYQDSVNMVTDNLSQEKSPCSETIKKFLKRNPNSPYKDQLKDFSNRQYMKPFIRRANNNGFSLLEVIQNFYISNISRRLILLIIASILPQKLQEKLLNKL